MYGIVRYNNTDACPKVFFMFNVKKVYQFVVANAINKLP